MTISTATNILCERENEAAVPMRESIRACAKAGFKNLDFGFAELAFFSERFRSDAWQAEMEEYKALAEELGIRFVQGHGCIFDFGKKDGSYEERFELLHKSIRGAAMLGIPWLVVHPSTFVEKGKKLESTHEKNVAFFKKLSSYCENYGVGIAIENMWGKTKDGVPRYAIRAEELLELIEDVGKKNVEACWDVEHASVEKLDQGGSIETCDHVTTHENPTFEKHGVVHYSVANIPGAVSRTSTLGITNATISYAVDIATKGYKAALQQVPGLKFGLNTIDGHLTNEAVAKALNLPFKPIDDFLA